MSVIVGFIVGVLCSELTKWLRDRRETKRVLWRVYDKRAEGHLPKTVRWEEEGKR